MKHKNAERPYVKYAAAAILLAAAAGFAACFGLSPAELPACAGKHPLPTALLFFLLYALKSATLFFPLVVLEAAVGFAYPLPAALAVNSIGMLIVLTVPYWIGRRRGAKCVAWALARYPKLGAFVERQQDHSFFLCFLLRVIGGLPGDAVTMYLGAIGVPFRQNLFAGSLGIFPCMVLATIMGMSLEDPTSPAFWISALLSAGLAGTSTALYFLYSRHQRRKEARQ